MGKVGYKRQYRKFWSLRGNSCGNELTVLSRTLSYWPLCSHFTFSYHKIAQSEGLKGYLLFSSLLLTLYARAHSTIIGHTTKRSTRMKNSSVPTQCSLFLLIIDHSSVQPNWYSWFCQWIPSIKEWHQWMLEGLPKKKKNECWRECIHGKGPSCNSCLEAPVYRMHGLRSVETNNW